MSPFGFQRCRVSLLIEQKRAWHICLAVLGILLLLGSAGAAPASVSVRASGVILAQPPPCAAFTACPTSGPAPLLVMFTDHSLNNPSSWKWEFRSETAGWTTFSTSKNPQYTFPAGVYDIRLTVSNTGGSTSATKSDYITVFVPERKPVARFYAYPVAGMAPLWVTFKDESLFNPIIYTWNFGDGTTSSLENPPPHEYQHPGLYIVRLIVANDAGSDTDTGFVLIFPSTRWF